MKAYKLEILVIDFDKLGGEGIQQEIENIEYPNHCIIASVMNIIERDIGEWTDNHPLNCRNTKSSEYQKLFGKKS